MTTWSVYILRCGDGSLYTGISTDIERRLRMHSSGRGAAYTRSHLPVTLVWKKKVSSGTVARKLEARIKSLSKKEKEAILAHRAGGW